MQKILTTKMFSKGQVVIPEQIRKALFLDSGTQFIVLAEGDVVVLKTISPPSVSEFNLIIKNAREQAKAVGMDHEDIVNAIKESRQSR